MGNCEAPQPGPWDQVGAAGVLKPFVCVNNRYGSGRAMAVWVRGITPKSLRAVEKERGLKKKKKREHRVIAQYEGAGEQHHFQEEEAENSDSRVFCVLCFPASVFLGYFITLLCPSFSIEPCFSASSKGNTIVKESVSHVTAWGVHLQLIMSAAAWWPLHLPPMFPGKPENYSA